jgi:hypothetical protein
MVNRRKTRMLESLAEWPCGDGGDSWMLGGALQLLPYFIARGKVVSMHNCEVQEDEDGQETGKRQARDRTREM